VIYPASRLPALVQNWLFLNPMAGVVTTYRDCVQGTALNWLLIVFLAPDIAGLSGRGSLVLPQTETRLADIL